MRRVARRVRARVEQHDQPLPVHLRIGPDHFLLSVDEARDLADQLHDAADDHERTHQAAEPDKESPR